MKVTFVNEERQKMGLKLLTKEVSEIRLNGFKLDYKREDSKWYSLAKLQTNGTWLIMFEITTNHDVPYQRIEFSND